MKLNRMRKMQKDSQGFTLVELMIVVAIIGILAAIAVPQFAAYRIRAINASAKSIGHNAKSSQSDLNAEMGCYGHTEAAALALNVASAAAGVADSGAVPAFAPPAGPATAGGRLSNVNAVTLKDFAVPFGIGANMISSVVNSAINAGTCPTSGCSYVVHIRATKGDTAYGMDSDQESALYSVSNPAWTTAGNGLLATAVAATDGVNDFAPAGVAAGGGGVPQATWQQAF